MLDINISNFITVGIIALIVFFAYGAVNRATGNKLPSIS